MQPALAAVLGLEPESVRVVCPWVGGGFGPKAAVYVEYLVAAAAAMQLGRPVKWVETRSEDMVALVQGRDYTMTAKLGLTNDGKIVGLDATVLASAGAYPAIGAVLPMLTQMMAVGVYDIPKVRFQGTTVVTNTTPIGAYRGAGRPEATQLIERVLDVAADQLGIDPAEIRRRNFLDPAAFPLTTTTGGAYDSGEYAKALDAALAAAGYDELRAEQARRRAGRRPGAARDRRVDLRRGDRSPRPAHRVRRGRGPRRRHRVDGRRHQRPRPGPPHRLRHGGQRRARHPDGKDPAGQLRHRRRAPRRRHPGLTVAADGRQRGPGRFQGGAGPGPADRRSPDGGQPGRHRRRCGRRARGRRTRSHPVLGRSWPPPLATPAASPRASSPARLRHEGDFDGTGSTFPFGAHVSVVDVDTETGQVTMRRHIAVDDCGRILNPLLVRGQQHGGIAQGAAQALFEWVQYDEDGNPLTSNLMDYAIPAASELSSFEASNTETDSPRNPLGAKGIGESGTIGSTPGHPKRRRRRPLPPRDHPHRHALHARAGVAGHSVRRRESRRERLTGKAARRRCRPSRRTQSNTHERFP